MKTRSIPLPERIVFAPNRSASRIHSAAEPDAVTIALDLEILRP